jgi:hypothetical protein
MNVIEDGVLKAFTEGGKRQMLQEYQMVQCNTLEEKSWL